MAFRGTGTQYFRYDGTGPCVVNGGADFGISLWFCADQTLTADSTLLAFGSTASNDPLFALRQKSADGGIKIMHRATGASPITETATSVNYRDSIWHHLMVWRKASGLFLSVDGSESGGGFASRTGVNWTETLNRFSVGNLVRAAAGTSLLLVGQVAQVTLFTRAPTAKERRLFASPNFAPLRNEGKNFVASGAAAVYYELYDDGLDDSSSAYHLTAVSSPAYVQTGEPWVDRTSFGASVKTLAANDPLKLLAADLADATSYSAVVTLTEPGQIAVGVVAEKATAEDAAVNVSVAGVTVGGGGAGSFTLDSSALENHASPYVENGKHVEARYAPGEYIVRVSSAAPMKGLIVRTSPNIVQGRGLVHSGPIHVEKFGHRWSVAREMYEYADLWLLRDGVAVLQVATSEDRTTADYNDVYHQCAAVVARSDGLVVFDASHSYRLRARFVPVSGGAVGTPGSLFGVGPATGAHSYLRGVPLSDDTVVLATRGTSTGSDTYSYTVYTIANAATSPTVEEDVLTTHKRNYPRDLQVLDKPGGGELVLHLIQRREGDSEWRDVLAAVQDPAAKTFANLDGSLVSGTTNGTVASPRFTATQVDNLVSAGGLRLMGNVGQIYSVQGCLADASNWPTSMRLLIAVGISAGGPLEYASSTLRWEIHNGATRSVSGTDFPAPTLPSNSYRYTGDFLWKDNDPTTGIAYAMVSDRGTRLASNTYDSPLEFYNDMQGGETLRVYRITAPLAPATIAFAEIDSITVSHGLPATEVNHVEGVANAFAYQNALNELQTHRQTAFVSYAVSDAGAITGTSTSTFDGMTATSLAAAIVAAQATVTFAGMVATSSAAAKVAAESAITFAGMTASATATVSSPTSEVGTVDLNLFPDELFV